MPLMEAAVPHRIPITFGLMLATIMSTLDITVVNVSLPHMQGNLSTSQDQITWVVTSYIAAAAVVTPVSGWLAGRLGLRTMLLIAVAAFTLSSMLCGIAANLTQMVVFRVLQGMASGPLAPLCQAVLLNINPPERYGRAMAIFLMGSVVVPVIGPVVGAALTEDFSWRWCFYINLPAGIGAWSLLWRYLPREAGRISSFDFLGFGSLAIGIAALQLMLDRGPSQDWFGSREICVEAALAAIGLWIFMSHMLTAKHPLFDRRIARDRNFVSTTILFFLFNFPLYAGITLLPLMMQGVLAFPPMLSGFTSVPRGVVMVATLFVIGRLDSLVDRRLLIGVGLLFCVAGFWHMTGFSLSTSSRDIITAGVLQGLGQGIIFVPLSALTFSTVAPSMRADATSIANLARNLAGSVGVSVTQALTARNTQVMHAALAAHITPGALALHALPFAQQSMKALASLNYEITRQALMIAYVDDFRLMVVLTLMCIPFLLLLSPPRSAGAVLSIDGSPSNPTTERFEGLIR